MEVEPNIVSEEAGKVYSELQVKQLLWVTFPFTIVSYSIELI